MGAIRSDPYQNYAGGDAGGQLRAGVGQKGVGQRTAEIKGLWKEMKGDFSASG